MIQKMKKSKGFTLIEMLVVIAIIAILVSIIIPVVSNSTVKASAATNAANLRSMQAEAVTLMLSGQEATSTNVKVSYDDDVMTVVANTGAPVAKAVGACEKDWTAFFYVDATTGDVTPYFAKDAVDSADAIVCDIEYFAEIAETGVVDSDKSQ